MAGLNLGKRANAGLFFLALIGGGIGIWWIKSISSNAWFAAGVSTFVVITLAIYYMLNNEYAPEEEGDNVYYLGLLFTLLSLVFTLMEIFGDGTGAIRNDEKFHLLLENFGIALTSTIAGIVGRIMVLNWQVGAKEPPPEPPRGFENSDRYHLWGVIREIKQVTSALALFHKTVRSYAYDTENDLRIRRETLQGESAAFKDTFQNDTETFTQSIKDRAENTLNAVEISLDGVAKEAEALIKKIESIHDTHTKELRETASAFHVDLQTVGKQSLDMFEQSLNAVSRQTVVLTQNTTTALERISNKFGRLESDLGKASVALDLLGTKADQATKSIIVLDSEAEKACTTFAAIHTSTESLANTLDTEVVVSIRQVEEALQAIVAEGKVATGQAEKFAGFFDALAQSIRETEGEVLQAGKAIRALSNEAETRTKALRKRERFKWRLPWR